MLPPRDTSQMKRCTQTENKEIKGYFIQMGKKDGVTVLISDKIDFKAMAILRDKEGHYIIIKETIQQEDITLVNIYAPNIGAPKYVKQILMDIKGENSRQSHRWGF